MQQVHMKEQGSQTLLEMYLRALDLEAFLDNYQAYAKDATRSGLPYERFLLALCEAEVSHRKAQKIERAIAAAKFPFVKELGTYDFTAVGSVKKKPVPEHAPGGYLEGAEKLFFVGPP